MQSVSIIGIGRLGGALAIALSRAGYVIESVVHRDPSKAAVIVNHLPESVRVVPTTDENHLLGSDIVIIATADPDIEKAAASIGGRLKEGSIVLHTSGSLSSEILAELARSGHPTGSIHPLISVSESVAGADSFSGAFFCVEGDPAAAETARAMVAALGGNPFAIDTAMKPLYHAAAVMACGHLVALIDMASEMLSHCRVERTEAKDILLPLISSTIANLEKRSPARALTGSFARLDVDAVTRHVAAIESEMPDDVRDAYLILGERSLELAASNGGNSRDVERLREVISIAKRKSG